jgi:hypothetical protein
VCPALESILEEKFRDVYMIPDPVVFARVGHSKVPGADRDQDGDNAKTEDSEPDLWHFSSIETSADVHAFRMSPKAT